MVVVDEKNRRFKALMTVFSNAARRVRAMASFSHENWTNRGMRPFATVREIDEADWQMAES